MSNNINNHSCSSQSADAKRFFALHEQQEYFILHNVWDAGSALLAQHVGCKAIATSSASLAWSLGYADGQTLPKEALLAAIRRIARVTKVPLSVDIESGYSDIPLAVTDLVEELQQIGVVGINLEDGNGCPSLLEAKISGLRERFGQSIFINARTDVYLAELVPATQAATETVQRGKRYQQAGADGLFVPGLLDPQVFRLLHEQLELPLNAMVPDIDSSFANWTNCPVQRISTGPFPYLEAMHGFIPRQTELDYAFMNQLCKSE